MNNLIKALAHAVGVLPCLSSLLISTSVQAADLTAYAHAIIEEHEDETTIDVMVNQMLRSLGRDPDAQKALVFLDSRYLITLLDLDPDIADLLAKGFRAKLLDPSSSFRLASGSWLGFTDLTAEQLDQKVAEYAATHRPEDPDDLTEFSDHFLKGLCEDLILAPKAN